MAKPVNAVSAVIGTSLAYLAWVVLGPQGRIGFLVDRGTVVGVSLAAAWCCRAAARRGRNERLATGWWKVALTACCWALFNAAAGVQDLLPRLALAARWIMDATALAAAVLALVAVLDFLDSWMSRTGRMRSLLDGLLMGTSFLFVGWALLLERTFSQSGAGTGRMLTLAYPLADVVLLALAIVLVLRVPPPSRLPWGLFAGGVTAVALAHSTFAYLQLAQAWAPGSPETFTWLVGALLIGVSAAMAGDDAPAPRDDQPAVGTALDVWVPFVPVLLAGAVGYSRARHGTLSSFLQVDGAVIVILLLARQVLAQLDSLGMARDLDARVRERTSELHRQERQFRSLVKHASDIVTVVDQTGRIRYQSESATRILGVDPANIVGRLLVSWVHPDDAEALLDKARKALPPPAPPLVVECRLLRADGRWCVCETTVSNLLDDESVRGIVLTSRDLSERKRFEEELRQQGLHDSLTGLANRHLLHDRLGHAIARASRAPHGVALLMLDLDGFKQVNDSLGHDAGDRLLVEVSRRLKLCVREGDTVARLGGDEFAVLLEPANLDMAELVARRVVGRLRIPVDVGTKSVVVQGSVGIAMGSTAEVGAEELMRNADLAMYEAKSQGKNGVVVYKPSMRASALARVELEADLRRAINRRELVVHYQPIVEIPSGRIASVEALARWHHPERGIVSPAEFVQVAEQSDLALSLGSWVLREACHAGRQFQGAYPTDPPLTVSVNLSTRQLRSKNIVEDVRAALEDTGLDPTTLILEITEGALMGEGTDTARTLLGLQELGVRLAIDDFGTGWSSLSRLREFPVDELKIDRSFVQEIRSSHDEAPIVAAVVAMAHSLGLQVVAEGVETIQQLTALNRYCCDAVQGYLLSKPIPAEALLPLLADPHGLLEPPRAGGDEPGSAIEPAAPPLEPGLDASGEVVDTASSTSVGEVVRYILAEFARVSGADAVYISHVSTADLTEQIRWVSTNGDTSLPEGLGLPWMQSPSHRMTQGGPRRIPALDIDYPEHELVRSYGMRTWAGVPVNGFQGVPVAVLGAVTTCPDAQSDNIVVMLELFSQLLTEHLGTAYRHAGAALRQA